MKEQLCVVRLALETQAVQPDSTKRDARTALLYNNQLQFSGLTSNPVLIESMIRLATVFLLRRSGVRTEERSDDRPKSHLSGRAIFTKKSNHLAVVGLLEFR